MVKQIPLIPDLRPPRLVRHRDMVDAPRIEALDALLIMAPAELAAAALQTLPAAASWAQIHGNGTVRAGEVRCSAIGARGQCAAVLGYAAAGADSFTLQSLAARMLGALGTRHPRRIGLAVLGRVGSAGQQALLGATIIHAFALPALRSAPPAPAPERIELFAAAGLDVRRVLAGARATNLVRWLTALPPNVLDAAGYRRLLGTLARRHGLTLRWYSRARLARMGAGAFAAVARANDDDAAGIAHLGWRGQPRRRCDVALVGKGVVFDTGGINLKPHRSMYDMHTDMSGSAVALATLLALAELRAPVSAEAWLAITENNIGPRAYRPQEVVRALNGRTIQIVHSDAEGRMVLADTLTLAARGRPKLIVDFATLTGACVTALGERYSGVFSADAQLAARAVAAGATSGERVWSFPVSADYDEELDSSVADVLQCTPDSKADHILAARFLARFVPHSIPWLHVDLSSATRKGGLGAVTSEVTGFGARFALQLLLERPWTR